MYVGERINSVIFPTLKNRSWMIIDQDRLAKSICPEIDKFNPFLNPDFCERVINDYVKYHEVDYSYERAGLIRSHLWKNSYLKRDAMRHLGCDYNVPSGTLLASPFDGVVVDVIMDNSEGGWGSAIAIEIENKDILIFAHLSGMRLHYYLDPIKKGQLLGCTGDKHENGGWYPHLHVQGLRASKFSRENTYFRDIDGYGPNDKTLEELGMFDPHDMLFTD